MRQEMASSTGYKPSELRLREDFEKEKIKNLIHIKELASKGMQVLKPELLKMK
jgi:hypothetical protein